MIPDFLDKSSTIAGKPQAESTLLKHLMISSLTSPESPLSTAQTTGDELLFFEK